MKFALSKATRQQLGRSRTTDRRITRLMQLVCSPIAVPRLRRRQIHPAEFRHSIGPSLIWNIDLVLNWRSASKTYATCPQPNCASVVEVKADHFQLENR